jgi:hypothetical protein
MEWSQSNQIRGEKESGGDVRICYFDHGVERSVMLNSQ